MSSTKPEERFSDRMRSATKQIHAISDSLVQAKLVCAFSNDRVWADGLLGFYEVFRFLEEAMQRSDSPLIKEMYDPVFMRTEAFQKDLNFYLPKDWATNHKINPGTVKCIEHLQYLESNDPIMLLAYIYHLYLGLVAGGYILSQKRRLLQYVPWPKKNYPSPNEGCEIIGFKTTPLSKINKLIKDNMNSIASKLDEETKIRLLEESKKVFLLNNEIIKNIDGTTFVLVKKLLVVAGIVLLGVGISYILSLKMKGHKIP